MRKKWYFHFIRVYLKFSVPVVTTSVSIMERIDLNCDMGESFGDFTVGNDESLMDYVSSVNIACGFHAGDPAVMKKTVALAVKKNLAIGAHPGYPDLQGFGRREINFTPN